MRSYLQRHVLELAVIQFCSYFLLTLNYRAVAEVNYLGTLWSDILIALLTFSSIKRVAAAETHAERIGYVIGGILGAQVALFLSTFLF